MIPPAKPRRPSIPAPVPSGTGASQGSDAGAPAGPAAATAADGEEGTVSPRPSGEDPASSSDARTPPPPKRVTSYAELPGSIKKVLPRMSIAGYSYADDAAMRMVVINERILREGEEVSPGVRLDRIEGDGKLLFSYKGFRFRPPH